jgi:hypothetical protein
MLVKLFNRHGLVAQPTVKRTSSAIRHDNLRRQTPNCSDIRCETKPLFCSRSSPKLPMSQQENSIADLPNQSANRESYIPPPTHVLSLTESVGRTHEMSS